MCGGGEGCGEENDRGWMDVIVVNRETMGMLRYASLEMGRGRVCDRDAISPPLKIFQGFPRVFESWRGSHPSQNTTI